MLENIPKTQYQIKIIVITPPVTKVTVNMLVYILLDFYMYVTKMR